MTVLLSGGGDPSVVVPLDVYFARSIDRQKPVLYVPIAMEPSSFSYDECEKWFRHTYAPYGIHDIEMCTDLNQVELSYYFKTITHR